jgi:excisionase family DNA binding protein
MVCGEIGVAKAETETQPIGVPPKEAWRKLGCSNAKGYDLLAAGELDSYTIGRARRITLESIERYVALHLSRFREVAA